jgi:hypothetical protein
VVVVFSSTATPGCAILRDATSLGFLLGVPKTAQARVPVLRAALRAKIKMAHYHSSKFEIASGRHIRRHGKTWAPIAANQNQVGLSSAGASGWSLRGAGVSPAVFSYL